MFKVSSILVPVDFSEYSEHALRYAVWLAKKLGAALTVCHVYPVKIYAAPPMLPAPIPLAEFRQQAQEALDELVGRVQKEEQVALASKLVEGIPHQEINRIANEFGADMVVMGTHGRTGIEKALMGSVAERVVRTCDAPVLTIRKT